MCVLKFWDFFLVVFFCSFFYSKGKVRIVDFFSGMIGGKKGLFFRKMVWVN